MNRLLYIMMALMLTSLGARGQAGKAFPLDKANPVSVLRLDQGKNYLAYGKISNDQEYTTPLRQEAPANNIGFAAKFDANHQLIFRFELEGNAEVLTAATLPDNGIALFAKCKGAIQDAERKLTDCPIQSEEDGGVLVILNSQGEHVAHDWIQLGTTMDEPFLAAQLSSNGENLYLSINHNQDLKYKEVEYKTVPVNWGMTTTSHAEIFQVNLETAALTPRVLLSENNVTHPLNSDYFGMLSYSGVRKMRIITEQDGALLLTYEMKANTKIETRTPDGQSVKDQKAWEPNQEESPEKITATMSRVRIEADGTITYHTPIFSQNDFTPDDGPWTISTHELLRGPEGKIILLASTKLDLSGQSIPVTPTDGEHVAFLLEMEASTGNITRTEVLPCTWTPRGKNWDSWKLSADLLDQHLLLGFQNWKDCEIAGTSYTGTDSATVYAMGRYDTELTFNDSWSLKATASSGQALVSPVSTALMVDEQGEIYSPNYTYTFKGQHAFEATAEAWDSGEEDHWTVLVQNPAPTPTPQPTPTGITLSQSTLELEVNGTETLTATLEPEGATGTIEWSTSEETVATVDANGKVTAVSAGEATITAAVSDLKATCVVTVKEPAPTPTKITLNKTTLELEVNGTETLKATLEPEGVDQSVTWTTSNKKVATVDKDGKVLAKAKGSTTITVASTVDPTITATCKVTVTEQGPTAVEEAAASILTVSPNPVTNTLRITGLEKATDVRVTNLLGQTVLQVRIQPDGLIDLGHLHGGFYVIKVNGQSLRILKR